MMLERHALEKRELQLIVEQVDQAEKQREQYDLTEFQGNFEMIRNRNIEEDHQMRSQLEEHIEAKRGRCNSQLVNYRTQTETNTQDYHTYLNRDAKSSKEVEQRLRQVERMQANIQQWKTKIQQNKQDCEERNAQLRTEKEQIQKHFQELKGRMNRFRAEQKKRLIDLTVNARNCQKAIKSQLEVAERVLKVSEACRKLETEHEKVMPFYLGREVDVDSLPLDDENLKEEIKETLADRDIDEWSYLDLYLKRYNKVQLDWFAVEKEKSHLDKENNQLRAILKQVLDGVSVNAEVLEQANPLLVVNGRVNLNHMPVARQAQTTFVEAAHHVASTQKGLVKA